MKQSLFFLALVSVCGLLFGCGPTKPPGGQPSGKVYEPAEEPGQIPHPTLKSASNRYGGALQEQAPQPEAAAAEEGDSPGMEAMNVTSREPAQPSKPSQEKASATKPVMRVVLGPVGTDGAQGAPGDAGKRIREVISLQLSEVDKLTLIDAPEERSKNDSPRPDLAAKGIRYVVKGTSSYNPESENTTVFLRIVATQSGKVVGVASGRGPTQDEAARETTKRLIRKLERVQ